MSIDIRDRIICTSFSSVSTDKEIRASLALSSEQGFKGSLIDLNSYDELIEDVAFHKNVNVAINFPYQGLSNSVVLATAGALSDSYYINDFYITLNKFDVSKSRTSDIRAYIKDLNNSCSKNINFTLELSWLKSLESVDKICSILEPYERHSLSISTYCKKPDKLSDILAIGKHLSSNGSCKYSYFGALPAKKEGIIELMSGGFLYCGVPNQFLGSVI